MTTLTMQPTRPEKGASGPREDRGRRVAARRLVLVGVLLAALVVVGVAANYGPLRHYLDARQRLERAAASVSALEERTAELQAQLGKLSQSGYLEDLARQQLTYALPGEELYVVTDAGTAVGGSSGSAVDEVVSAASGLASEGLGAALSTGAGMAAAGQALLGSEESAGFEESSASDTSATGQTSTPSRPGFIERILLAISAFL